VICDLADFPFFSRTSTAAVGFYCCPICEIPSENLFESVKDIQGYELRSLAKVQKCLEDCQNLPSKDEKRTKLQSVSSDGVLVRCD
jgi:hypothetical protein